jgi:hypothetical protein
MVWQLQGSPNQQAIVAAALDRCTFPFDVMLPELHSEMGKTAIPVDWADLSRYAGTLAAQRKGGGHGHVHEDGDTADPIEVRHRVLGLAWYSGKVTLDLSMERDPTLAGEVFLSEGAHMLDFFWFTNDHRVAVWNALHARAEHITTDALVQDGTDLGHSHGWFDVGGYRSWIGEAWMGLFTLAYSDFPVTIPFDHPPTRTAVEAIRSALTPYFSSWTGTLHDSHRGIAPAAFHVTPPDGARRCGVCKPGAST